MKLQYMMQSQWNEAVQMLATTPQRKVCINVEILEKILCTTDMLFLFKLYWCEFFVFFILVIFMKKKCLYPENLFV